LTDTQLAQCTPADEVEALQLPIPTQMVSNGEYMPVPQTLEQRRVEARIHELAASASKKLGMSRRQFLAGTGGMAAAFLAMNDVFGRFFNVSPIEMFEPAAYAASAAPEKLFVFDDQTHLVRSSRNGGQLVGALRAIAQGPTTPGFSQNPFNPMGQLDELGSPWTPWNPALVGAPLPPDVFDVINYIESFFLQSQTTVAILSNAPGSIFAPPGEAPRPPRNIAESEAGEILTAAQTAGVRDFVNAIAGSTRMLAHGILRPGVGNLEFMQFQIDSYRPDSWKGYNITNSAKVDFDPNSNMQRWRHDDEEVAYPTFELIMKNKDQLKLHPGFRNICVHKGLAPGPPAIPERGFPTDMPKAAQDWPELNFITYHSCIQPAFWNYQALAELQSGQTREGVPDISWTTMYAQLVSDLDNCYAEIGTTFASSVITFPTVWAHIIGQLLRYLGEDRIVFGTDSLWYGTPQWQIEAMWRFAIPEELRDRYRYPELTEKRRRKILGLNSGKLYGLKEGIVDPNRKGVDDGVLSQKERYGPFYHPVPANFEALMPASLKTLLEFPGFANDTFSRMRARYAEMGGERSDTRYGWIRSRV
jgi:predicted TIM-barrel fold metal-dependent hydrolase